MAKTKKTKGFEKLEDGEKYLTAVPRGATHQVAAKTEGSLTTNQGVIVADNQNTLKSGPRGPSLLEDFAFLEKLTHFDLERIPERIVHARGSGAHGYFEVTNPIPHLTKAPFLAEKGKKTEVFARSRPSPAGREPAIYHATCAALRSNSIRMKVISTSSETISPSSSFRTRSNFPILSIPSKWSPTEAGIADDLHEGVLELDARTGAGKYIEAAKRQRVWDRESRLSEGDA